MGSLSYRSVQYATAASSGVGMAIAAGIGIGTFGHEVAGEEILRAAGLTTVKEMRECGVEWYDIRLCVPVLRTFRERARAKALGADERAVA